MTDISDELFKMTATEAVGRLRSKEVSPLDLVEASIKRIETVDYEVNSLPIHCFEQAREQAKSFDFKRHESNPKSLCGLPIAVKDYNDLGGAVTTMGGTLISTFITLDASVGVIFTMKALIIIIMGGVGDIRGAIVAALILGLVETTVARLIDPGLTLAAAYAIFVLVLLFRPQGLFGRKPT